MNDFIAVQKRGDKWHVWTDRIENHFPIPSGEHHFVLSTQEEALAQASSLYFDLSGVTYGIMPLDDIEGDPIKLAIITLKESAELMADSPELWENPIVDKCLSVVSILRELQQKGD